MNASWGTSTNWDSPPESGNEAGIIFYSAANQLTTFLGANLTVRSVTFDENATSDVSVRLTSTSGGTVLRTLTFAADSGNASLNIDDEASGNFTFGVRGQPGIAVQLDSSLDINHDGSGLLLFNRAIGGAGGIVKNGSGTLRLDVGTESAQPNASSFAGGVTINSGRVEIANSSALGSGALSLSSANQAVLRLESGITVANTITFSNTNATSAVEVVVASSAAFRVGTSGTLQSRFAGGQADTTVRILGGTNSSVSNTTLLMSLADSSPAGNDSIRVSDVLNLTGTGSDIFVLELGVADVSAGQFLGWLDPDSGTWLNAITENSATGILAQQNFAGSFAASGASATADYLGSWGYDTTANTVWAVLDHNSAFAVVPEPGAGLLLGLGAAFIFWRKRRRSVSVL